jgi:uncharacterized protein HemY
MQKEALEKMLAQGQDNALLRYTLGSIHLKERDYPVAAAHLQRALEQDGQHSASWKLYGKALTELGRADEAKAAYDKGIAVAKAKGDVQAVKEMQVFRKRLD